MENASKALLMAGGVLISIIVASLLMIMVNSLTSYQQVDNENKREAQIVKFNNQYEGYVGRDVRGNEIYSLVNKIIDYNKRETTAGTLGNEGFQPIKLKIEGLDGNEKLFNMDMDESSKAELITGDITINGVSGIKENIKFEKIDNLLKTYIPANSRTINRTLQYTDKILEKLVNSYDLLFNYKKVGSDYEFITNLKLEEKIKVLKEFNNIVGVEDYFDLKQGGSENFNQFEDRLNRLWTKYLSKDASAYSRYTNDNIWHDVNLYFEYLQFKRAIFTCDSSTVKYDVNSGRIIEMTFEFTGRFD